MTNESVSTERVEGKAAPNLLDAAEAALAVFDVWQSDGTRYAEASDLRAAIAAHRQQSEDNALLLGAIVTGRATIEQIRFLPQRIRFLVQVSDLKVDVGLSSTDCPILTDELRSALRAAMGGGK